MSRSVNALVGINTKNTWILNWAQHPVKNLIKQIHWEKKKTAITLDDSTLPSEKLVAKESFPFVRRQEKGSKRKLAWMWKGNEPILYIRFHTWAGGSWMKNMYLTSALYQYYWIKKWPQALLYPRKLVASPGGKYALAL